MKLLLFYFRSIFPQKKLLYFWSTKYSRKSMIVIVFEKKLYPMSWII